MFPVLQQSYKISHSLITVTKQPVQYTKSHATISLYEGNTYFIYRDSFRQVN